MEFYGFESRKACETALEQALINELKAGLKNNGFTSLALAGGNTPKYLYSNLSKAELDWSKVKVTLTDERWVDLTDDESNQAMIQRTLLQNNAQKCQLFGLKNSENTPEIGQIRCADMLNKSIPNLDFAVLGMGSDGHFASIFPGMSNTDDMLNLEQDAPCLAAHPKAKPPRMTLTLSYLLKAKHIFLFITGQDKKQVLDQMEIENVENKLPIYYLINQTQCPVSVYWSES